MCYTYYTVIFVIQYCAILCNIVTNQYNKVPWSFVSTSIFLSILKTIRSELAKSFSLHQGVRFIIDANEDDVPVRE